MIQAILKDLNVRLPFMSYGEMLSYMTRVHTVQPKSVASQAKVSQLPVPFLLIRKVYKSIPFHQEWALSYRSLGESVHLKTTFDHYSHLLH